jgi:hypothetical protein
MLDNCKKGNHSLKKIYEAELDDMESSVVRWCELCGAIVVDKEYDYRVDPGGYSKMRWPKY